MKETNIMRGAWLCALYLCAPMAWAQGASVAPFPLQVRRSPADFNAKSEEALQADFRKMVREQGVVVPNSFLLNTALADLKRQDCDRENECLKLLAVKADTLYAMYVSVDFDLGKNVIAVGRVVRNDGVEVVPQKTVQLTLGKDSFGVVAKLLLGRLVREELKVGALAAAKPVAVVTVPAVVDAGVVMTPVGAVDAGVVFTPPPPPPAEESPLKTIGYVAVGVGGAAAVTGAILFGVGSGSARPVIEGKLVPANDQTNADAVAGYRQALTLQPVGLALLLGGIGVGAAGVVMAVIAPSSNSKVMFVPMTGGAYVGISGELP